MDVIGDITSHIDVAQVVLYAFWIFFAGLIFYLRREDRREGYPLESEVTGETDTRVGGIWVPEPKVFLLPHGGTAMAPSDRRDPEPKNMEPVEPWSGAPFQPTGNPMLDGVGPASYAHRADVPERMEDGSATIVPLRVATDFTIAEEDPDPRGMEVVGADRKVAGTVKDVWVDRAEQIIRYLEIEVPARQAAQPAAGEDEQSGAPSTITVLAPMTMSEIKGGSFKPHFVKINALTAEQFADVPKTQHPDQVTLLEEDKIVGYYGGGTLYAMPRRLEPML
ncbi:photosynthetic reaction center subunit H [Dichotomicrobium thermohalophilum]|uniref:Photosynthetic reaction center H subunit n=1 Tax=Dichotomicrobium thermohalophilum TaxID=933063 RepID=A0A397Q6Y1_9HYPH|nr:photosynthetic reaction center subunit H [Dichotomicrobium thermohalophilum]RIA56723.1 photosynthetic reaction center H subunit [Dichotomicrobium thermohalophilum]